MSYEKFLRYQSEVKEMIGDNELIMELQKSVLDEADEIAEQADKLERAAADEANEFRQVEVVPLCWTVWQRG